MPTLKQLSGLDSLFLYAENSRTPLEVSSLHIYDPSTSLRGSVRFKEVIATFDQRRTLVVGWMTTDCRMIGKPHSCADVGKDDGSVIEPFDARGLEARARKLVMDGVDTAAVALMHAYRNPAHEQLLARAGAYARLYELQFKESPT